jgi:DNA relaxase NicK
MESANWTGSRGQGRRKPSITLVRSSDGLNTVYAGSRQYERFLRVYVKPDREGYRYVRYELEIKGKTADRIFTKLLNDYGFNVVGILSDSIGRIPQEVSELDPFREFMEGIEGVAVVSGRKIADHSATLLWLEQTVTASVSKCLGNHNTRDDTIAWVNQLVDMVQRIEK